LGCEFEVREAVDGEGGAAEGVFGSFYGAVHEGLGAVAFVEDFVRPFGDDCETWGCYVLVNWEIRFIGE
jgi:hypothetical protein